MTRSRISFHVRLGVLRRDGYACCHCGVHGTFWTLQIDHVEPWSWSAIDEAWNLQTLCGPCNRRKAARYCG